MGADQPFVGVFIGRILRATAKIIVVQAKCFEPCRHEIGMDCSALMGGAGNGQLLGCQPAFVGLVDYIAQGVFLEERGIIVRVGSPQACTISPLASHITAWPE